ncbi:MAG: hypothetical protein ABH804_02850 [archaeon]
MKIIMKKGLFLLIFLSLILLNFFSFSLVSAQCYDSDGGIEKFILGGVYIGKNLQTIDRCENLYVSENLIEYYCDGGIVLELIEVHADHPLATYGDRVRFRDSDGKIYEAVGPLYAFDKKFIFLYIGDFSFIFSYHDDPNVRGDENIVFSEKTYYVGDWITFEEARLKSKKINCEYGCSMGVCKKPTGNDGTTNVPICEDSDELNYFLPKVINIGDTKVPDSCFSISELNYSDVDKSYYNNMEVYYCEKGYINYKNYTCPHKARWGVSEGIYSCYCVCIQDSECPRGYSCKEGLCAFKTTCSENWVCSSWSDCTNNKQTRTCTDLNNCGTNLNKPIPLQTCEIQCSEKWVCSSWSDCTNNKQTRTCTDLNNCGTNLNKPSTSQSCDVQCIEKWECSDWGGCVYGQQTRTCTDLNNCGTINNKPSQSKSCQEETIFCDECRIGNKCYPFGYRKYGLFCSDDFNFQNQLEENSKCNHNFECKSNLCINSVCISGNIIQIIINWFKNFFS